MSQYTVPEGYIAYITNWWFSDNRPQNGGSCDIAFLARNEGGVFRNQGTVGVQIQASSFGQIQYNPYRAFQERTDLKVTAISTNANHDISTGYGILLVPKADPTEVVPAIQD